jgi:hypothetical protein
MMSNVHSKSKLKWAIILKLYCCDYISFYTYSFMNEYVYCYSRLCVYVCVHMVCQPSSFQVPNVEGVWKNLKMSYSMIDSTAVLKLEQPSFHCWIILAFPNLATIFTGARTEGRKCRALDKLLWAWRGSYPSLPPPPSALRLYPACPSPFPLPIFSLPTPPCSISIPPLTPRHRLYPTLTPHSIAQPLPS